MNIPDEAVEAAALALNWHNTRCKVPTASFMDEARIALAAAAPHLMAQAWDEGHDAGFTFGAFQGRVKELPNPYRSAGAGE